MYPLQRSDSPVQLPLLLLAGDFSIPSYKSLCNQQAPILERAFSSGFGKVFVLILPPDSCSCEGLGTIPTLAQPGPQSGFASLAGTFEVCLALLCHVP